MCRDFHGRMIKAERELVQAQNQNEALRSQLHAARPHDPAQDRYES